MLHNSCGRLFGRTLVWLGLIFRYDLNSELVLTDNRSSRSIQYAYQIHRLKRLALIAGQRKNCSVMVRGIDAIYSSKNTIAK